MKLPIGPQQSKQRQKKQNEVKGTPRAVQSMTCGGVACILTSWEQTQEADSYPESIFLKMCSTEYALQEYFIEITFKRALYKYGDIVGYTKSNNSSVEEFPETSMD